MPYSPRIGVVTYGLSRDPAHYLLPVAYVHALRRAGARPVLFVPGEAPESLLEVVDGVLLAGGGDVDPTRYRQSQHATVSGVDAERDQTELGLARLIVERRVPVLGVCRGLQVLNVALGGTLHQHVPAACKTATQHRGKGGTSVRHAVRVTPGTRLASICGQTHLEIASIHHQAVDQPGAGVRVSARAEGDLVEAIELEQHSECIAVQWHPELTAAEDSSQQNLFAWLTEAARRRRPIS